MTNSPPSQCSIRRAAAATSFTSRFNCCSIWKRKSSPSARSSDSSLGREYQSELWRVYENRVPGAADLCCYWFEKARDLIDHKHCKRAGLLGTQAIRGGANREVLKRIRKSGDIFFAISDRDWILDG